MKYFIQLAPKVGSGWEVVDEYTHNNSHKAITKDGEPRYSECKFMFDGQHLHLYGIFSPQALAQIMRMVGIPNSTFASVYQDQALLYTEPEYIKFKLKKRTYVHEIGSKVETSEEEAPEVKLP